MSTYGCTISAGSHSFNHNSFMLWAAKAYRHACAREAGAGAGPIELNLGEGWMPLEDISTADSFRMRIRRHPTNGEISFTLAYEDGKSWKRLVQGKLEQNPTVSMMVKRVATVVSAYMLEYPAEHAAAAGDIKLLGSGDSVMDLRPDMSSAVEDILLANRTDSEAALLLEFIETLIVRA